MLSASVVDSVVRESGGGLFGRAKSFVEYTIQVAAPNTNDSLRWWSVHRRYSDFADFHRSFVGCTPASLVVKPLPTKTWAWDKLSESHRADRMQQLQAYLDSVLGVQAGLAAEPQALLFEFLGVGDKLAGLSPCKVDQNPDTPPGTRPPYASPPVPPSAKELEGTPLLARLALDARTPGTHTSAGTTTSTLDCPTPFSIRSDKMQPWNDNPLHEKARPPAPATPSASSPTAGPTAAMLPRSEPGNRPRIRLPSTNSEPDTVTSSTRRSTAPCHPGGVAAAAAATYPLKKLSQAPLPPPPSPGPDPDDPYQHIGRGSFPRPQHGSPKQAGRASPPLSTAVTLEPSVEDFCAGVMARLTAGIDCMRFKRERGLAALDQLRPLVMSFDAESLTAAAATATAITAASDPVAASESCAAEGYAGLVAAVGSDDVRGWSGLLMATRGSTAAVLGSSWPACRAHVVAILCAFDNCPDKAARWEWKAVRVLVKYHRSVTRVLSSMKSRHEREEL